MTAIFLRGTDLWPGGSLRISIRNKQLQNETRTWLAYTHTLLFSISGYSRNIKAAVEFLTA